MKKTPVQIDFNVAPELLGGLQHIRPEEIYTLADTDLEGTVIKSVETSVRMSERSIYNVVGITSIVVPEADGLFHDTVSDQFADLVNDDRNMQLTAQHLKETSSLGALKVKDYEVGNINNIVTPIMLGKFWFIDSVLDHYYEADSEKDYADLSRLLSTHSFMLNSLARAIGSVQAEEDIDVSDKKQRPKRKIITLSGPTQEANSTDIVLYEALDDEVETEVKKNIFSAFYGIDGAIEQLQEVIDLANVPAAEREKYGVKLTQGIVLSGPSGVGKTELTSALAEGLNADLIELKFSDLSSTYTGEWAKNIAKMFDQARSRDGRVVLLFDEADGLVKAGNEGSNKNIESVLKKELEQLHKSPDVFVVFATNDESQLSPEIRAKKRIPLTVRIDPPSDVERAMIFDSLVGIGGVKLEDLMTEEGNPVWDMLQFDPNFYDFTELAKNSDGLTAGDIVSVINEVRKKRFLKYRDTPDKLKSLISQDEILSGLKRFKATKEA